MRPGVGAGMVHTDLVDGPGALADAVAALEVEVFDDVQHAGAHPYALVAGLLLDGETVLVVGLREGLVKQDNRVATRALAPLGQLVVLL